MDSRGILRKGELYVNIRVLRPIPIDSDDAE